MKQILRFALGTNEIILLQWNVRFTKAFINHRAAILKQPALTADQ
ncbi:MAG TPA: hypothetical protein VGP85_03145 [Pyrinomonadaceae bacterium]|nr:hypothetical protein [Pyrinomonadaceae bacterium]